MTKTIRWGILGSGGIARMFTNDLVRHGFNVHAVGSRAQSSADAFAASYDSIVAHGSYEALVADPEVDVIYVATPHPAHRENALLALNGGKHVLVEKPFTINAREAQVVVDRAVELDRVVLEAMWTRFLPHMIRIRSILAEGKLGDLRTFTGDHQQALPEDPDHRINSLALGGGALLDLGIYPISFASQLFGPPASIQATGVLKATGADAQVATVFGYEGDQIATTVAASNGQGPNRASIVGSEGRIEIDPVWYNATGFQMFDRAGELVETFRPPVEGRGMHYQAAEMERLILAGERVSELMPTSETVSIMATLDRIREQIGVQYPSE
ncbi:MAG: oxidoreductase [Pseudonocardiales bacterium]|nr:oxidoreductase [Pseudonocardiales bacterium]